MGIVGPEGHLQQLDAFWGANADAVQYLAARIGMAPPEQRDHFGAGSMFWARLESLRDVLDARLSDAEFEQESGQLDGTLAHAVERLFATCASHAGFTVDDATSIAGIAAQDPSGGPTGRT